MKINVSIGHSSKDKGAVTKDESFSEYEFNSLLAQTLKELLIKEGFNVIVTNRLTDGGGTGMTADVRAINATDADISVELHCNAFNNETGGCETLYWHKSVSGKKLAQSIQNEMVSALGNNNRGIKPINSKGRGGTVLRDTKMPMVITEPFFIDNPKDFSNGVNKIDKLALAITRGIKFYFCS